MIPGWVQVPSGGLKVAYELANGLARRGHHVRALHLDPTRRFTIARRIRHRAAFALTRRRPLTWFAFDPRIRMGLIDPERPDALPAGDVVIGVGWRAAAFVADAPRAAGRGHYLSMDYMAPFEGSPGEVDAAWRAPLRKLVTAHWLEEKARELCGPDVDVTYISLGIGAEHGTTVDPAMRPPNTVLMHYYPSPRKGFRDGLDALERCRADLEIDVTIFGASRPAPPLPEWVRFVHRPRNLAPIYNSAAIFLHSSRHEGFGLPPAEAMASSCAVAASANIGVREYAVDGVNALLAPVGDVERLATAVRRLVVDDDLRLRLARQGREDVARFTWDRAVSALQAALR